MCNDTRTSRSLGCSRHSASDARTIGLRLLERAGLMSRPSGISPKNKASFSAKFWNHLDRLFDGLDLPLKRLAIVAMLAVFGRILASWLWGV